MEKTTIVTYDLLKKLGACDEQLRLFLRLFPLGANLSIDEHVQRALDHDLDAAWLLGKADGFIDYPDVFLKKVLLFSGEALAYVREQTEEMCLSTVSRFGEYLAYVKKQTPEICLAAVSNNGYALEIVHEQTHEICLAAVSNTGWALEYVREQTPEICLAAVSNDGYALGYVREQTPEICLAAVKQNGLALMFAREQTMEVCLAAIEDIRALQFVDEGLYGSVVKHLRKKAHNEKNNYRNM